MRLARLNILFLLLLMAETTAIAGVVDKQRLVWVGYQNQLHFSERWSIQTEFDMRRYMFPDRQFQWLAPRVQARYKNGIADFGLGCAYFINFQPQDTSPITGIRKEWRPHFELILTQPIKKLRLNHRYRIEERFIENTDAWDFSVRMRYMLRLNIPLLKDADKLVLQLYEEIMINAGGSVRTNIFDQNRVYGGIQYALTDNLSASVGYMNSYQQRISGVDFYNRHIVRFTLTQNIYTFNKTKEEQNGS